jgi:hypothetical protein
MFNKIIINLKKKKKNYKIYYFLCNILLFILINIKIISFFIKIFKNIFFILKLYVF